MPNDKKIIADYRNETSGPNAGMVQYEGEKEPRFPDSAEPQEEATPAKETKGKPKKK